MSVILFVLCTLLKPSNQQGLKFIAFFALYAILLGLLYDVLFICKLI